MMTAAVRQVNGKEQAHILQRLIRATTLLNKHLDEENKTIESGNIATLKQQMKRKVDLLHQFQAAEEILKDFATHFALDKSDSNLTKLSNCLKDMEHLSEKNQMLLMVHMEISDQIVSHYKEVQSKEAIAKSGYNKEGKMNAAENSNKAITTASLNNKI